MTHLFELDDLGNAMIVKLPRNGFGVTIMLIALLLVATVPFTIVFWLMLKIAPWWVATPLAISASVVTLFLTVSRKT